MPSAARSVALAFGTWMAFATAVTLHADGGSLNDRFLEGNQFYEQGNYTNAIETWQAILKEGRSSPALHFNLGNAYLRSGQLGRAILHYRLAERSSPRDPDIRANLAFARRGVEGPAPTGPPAWKVWLTRLSFNEWTLATSVGLALLFLVLATQTLAARRLRRLTFLAILTVIFTLGSAVGMAGSWYHTRHSVTGIFLVSDAPVRYGPVAASETSFTARDGMEFPILDREGDWLQVIDPAGRIGWIESRFVALDPE